MQISRTQAATLAAVVGAVAMPAGAHAATKTVYAGGPASFQKKLGFGYVDSFLNNTVTIHVGDSVVWDGKALAGGFHTVDLPLTGGTSQPLILPTGTTVSGVNDAAGNPFWFDGKVPAVGFNPKLFARSSATSYNGTKALDSGLPIGKPADFKVRFTKAGTYKYFCDVHSGMVGYVVVKAKRARVPTPKADANALKAAEKADTKEVQKLSASTTAPANEVSLGAAGPGGVGVFAMFPATLSVTAGTKVTFFMSPGTRENHTATFGPAAYLTSLARSFQGPAPSPAAIYPSNPPGTITENPTAHGNGFANVGVLQNPASAAIPSSGAITFTTPGTYHYICLIHPFMKATVVVK